MCSGSSRDAVADLECALDRVAAENVKSMFGPQVLDRTARLLLAQNRLDAQIARSVREGELTQAPEHDGQKTMQSWLRGHGRLSPSAAGKLVRSGRALEHLPAVAAAFADGHVTAEQVALIAPVTRDQHRAAAEAQGVDLAAVDATLAEVAATRPHSELAQVVHHYLERLDPDGPEPDPTEGRLLSFAKHADGSVSGRFELDAVGGEKVQAVLESMVQANRPAGDTRSRGQQLGDAFVQWADITLAAGHTADPAHGQAARGRHHPARRPGRPAYRPGSRRHRLRRHHLRGASPLVGLRRQRQPADHRPRRRADRPRAHQTGGPAPAAAGHRVPGPELRVRRVRRAQLLVRRPPPDPLDRRRRDQLGELRPAVRTAPHQGASRLPDRATTRRPMAHLATRRHRDRPAPPTCCAA